MPPLQHRWISAEERVAYEAALHRFMAENASRLHAKGFALGRAVNSTMALATWGALSLFGSQRMAHRRRLDLAALRFLVFDTQGGACADDAEDTVRWEYASWCCT